MSEDEARERARRAVELALHLGAADAEATVVLARRFSSEARGERITKLDASAGRSLSVRLFADGRRTTVSGTQWSDDDLRASIEIGVAQLRCVSPDPHATLPDNLTSQSVDLDLYDTSFEARNDEERLKDALALELAIRKADSRIDNSNGSHYEESIATVALANSRGFHGSYRSTRGGTFTSPVASDGGFKRTAHYGSAARKLAEIEDAAFVGAEAVRRTVAFFGSSKPPTQSTALIFDREVAASVLSDLFAACNAANVAVGNSWLAGRIGDRIGSELLDIADDGRLPGRLGSSPFDAEGVATRRTPVFERGVLRSYLFDTYYARRLGSSSTGNSTAGGIGPNTFSLRAGKVSVEGLIASTRAGILILETIGFATEHASGMYSRGARGIAIRNGELAEALEEFTIAAPFPELLAGIDGVADDVKYDGSIVSPTFRVAEMQVSGH